MVRKNIDISDREREQADQRKLELGITDREAYLLGLGIEAPKRVTGRPKKDHLRFLGESGKRMTSDNESFENKVYRP